MTDEGLHPLLNAQLDDLGLSKDATPSKEQWQQLVDNLDADYRQRHDGALILDRNFDNMIRHAVDGFVIHGTRGNIIDANEAACEMLGYSRDELLSLKVADFELELDPGAIWDDMTVDEVFTVEGTHLRKDGQTYPVETRVGAFMVDGQKVILALCRDITERKEAEQRLHRLNRQLQTARDEAVRANRTKSAFLANMSHELRTPLNAVIGYSEFLIEEMNDGGDDDYVEDLERILTAGRHLLSLINDILDLSKVEAGKVELEIDEFELTEMLDDIESTARPLADKNDNTFVHHYPDQTISMRGDVTKIRQILFNLLSNAFKFTSEGEVRLEVEQVCIEDVDAISFSVADDGVGMNEEELSRVFDAFQQADSSTTRKFGGTGLGLAITQRYCLMMGGTIDVESTPGEGTTFTVVLPVDGESKLDASSSEESEFPSAEDTTLAAQSTVLVIEDDPAARDLLERTLSGEGYQVVTATDGVQGVQLARQLKPAAITLDLLMPEMDGWQVLHRIKEEPDLRDTPVILISMLDERKKGFALGAEEFLVKPVDREHLLAAVGSPKIEDFSGRCLVVDDDEPTRELISRVLEGEGWEVDRAKDGSHGLELARQQTPDLVLLDLMMPQVDGFEFLSRFRGQARFSAIPVIVCTAKELTEQERQVLNQTTSQVIEKSGWGPGEILAEVRRALRDTGV